MHRRISLPSYARKPGSPVHPFPYQVSMTVLELLQAATFYPVFMDTAFGVYRDSTTDPMNRLRQAFTDIGMSQENWELNTNCLAKYIGFLPSPVMQSAVIAGLSQWDWYVGKLGRFIEFARQFGPKPIMTVAVERNLPLIPLRPFSEQAQILKEASDNTLEISDSCFANVSEMILARNLGVHCNWEVTSYYLKNSKTTGWALGDVREVSHSELEVWRDALYSLINDTSRLFAKMYAKVPDFDPYASS